jgi:hypothetical protein
MKGKNMKTLTWTTLLLLALLQTALGQARFRTDINPALRYYQALLEAPRLPDEDRQYLFVPEWRGQVLEPRFGDLMGRYDIQFRLLREAGHAAVPCDWGIDLSEGPDALLPGLAPCKAAAQAARLRVMWHLQNGRQAAARDDLLAAFTLARNVSWDGVLISALVQIAMENILTSVVAENFYQWQPEVLSEVLAGFEAAPARGTIQACVATERSSFYGWLLRKVTELQQKNAGNEPRTLEEIKTLVAKISGENGPDLQFAERLLKAAGGTSDGVVKLARELEPLYDRASVLMALPHGEFEEEMKSFIKEVSGHPNPLVSQFFPVFEKCRPKEFGAIVKLAMLRAGTEYKLKGDAGFQQVLDPLTRQPFGLERFVLNGEDRGFKVTSTYNGQGFEQVLIFVEKNGEPFRIDGKNAGKPIPKPEATKP